MLHPNTIGRAIAMAIAIKLGFAILRTHRGRSADTFSGFNHLVLVAAPLNAAPRHGCAGLCL
jgi:hypothetical protein